MNVLPLLWGRLRRAKGPRGRQITRTIPRPYRTGRCAPSPAIPPGKSNLKEATARVRHPPPPSPSYPNSPTPELAAIAGSLTTRAEGQPPHAKLLTGGVGERYPQAPGRVELQCPQCPGAKDYTTHCAPRARGYNTHNAPRADLCYSHSPGMGLQYPQCAAGRGHTNHDAAEPTTTPLN